jgi:hypothetical protein
MSPVLQALAALVPPIGVGLVFWLVIRSIVQADRRERAAMAALDAQQRAASAGAAPPPAPLDGSDAGDGPVESSQRD